jgi:hypothetical protein
MHRAQNFAETLKFNNRAEYYESSNQLAFVTIDKDKPENFEFSRLTGKSLRPYELMAESLVSYLERVMSIRISKMYLDFTLSMDGIIYLTNLKWLEFKQSIKLELDSESLTCTIYCKLCGIIFKKDDVSKTLTYKLLYELVEHLKRRTRREDQTSKLLHELKFN